MSLGVKKKSTGLSDIKGIIPLSMKYSFSKCGSEDPDQLYRRGGSEDPDPLFPNVDPGIRIHVKMRWIRNAASDSRILVYGGRLMRRILLRRTHTEKKMDQLNLLNQPDALIFVVVIGVH